MKYGHRIFNLWCEIKLGVENLDGWMDERMNG